MNNQTGPALRTNVPLVVLGALLAGTLLTRCSASNDPGTGGAGSGGAAGSSAGGGTGAGGAGDASDAGSGSAGAAGSSAGGGGGGTSGGAGASGECTPATVPVDCPLPPSVCDDTRTLRYYTDASCVAGQCQWTRATLSCGGGSCVNGACLGSGTTTTGGPPASGTGG